MKFADATPIDDRGHRTRQTELLISERVGWVELSLHPSSYKRCAFDSMRRIMRNNIRPSVCFAG
jgi:hypothetical protein